MPYNHFSEQSSIMSSRTNSSTLPQGFSVYQPTLGAQLQFLPAIGTTQLDELLNAYIPGPASAQEKRASVSLDFLEYSHLTGQSFKFYAVYPMATPVESPATVSPVMSTWDWSQASTSSRSPTSQKARTSPKAGSSRHQADFSHIPGMKIMTKDGLDVTNSASRGSKTKEQRDHAHLMRIIKACDSCKRKKIRCDPSHKKRGVSQASHSHSQPAARVTKKARSVAQEALNPAPAIFPQTDFSVVNSAFTIDQSFAAVDMEMTTPALPALEPWEEFIQYPTADLPADYDFFYDPEGYLSPESSSSLSAFSTKPVTPTSQQDLSGSFSLSTGEAAVPSPQLPFNQTDSIHDYVDFNLFSPQSSFSEDDHMVPIEMSRQVASQSQPLQPNLFRSDQSSPENRGADSGEDALIGNTSVALWSASLDPSGEEKSRQSPYRDPGLGVEDYYGRSSSSLSSDAIGNAMSWMDEIAPASTHILDACPKTSDNMVLGDLGIDSAESSTSQRVSTMEGIRQPTGLDNATTMTRAGFDIYSQRVGSDGLTPLQSWLASSQFALSNTAYAAQPASRVEPESSIGATTIPTTTDVPMVENAGTATISSSLGASQSVAEYDSVESSDGLQVTSGGGSITASRSVDSDVVNTATGSSGTNLSSIRRGAIAAYATTIANYRLKQSPASRGIVAGATVTPNLDASGQAPSEQGVVTLSQIAMKVNTESSTSNSHADQDLGALSRAPSDRDLSLSSQNAPRVETRTLTYYSPPSTGVLHRRQLADQRVLGNDDGVSLMPLMTSAMALLATGSSAESAPGHSLTTMISAMLLLLAITGWFYQLFTPSLRSLCGQSLNSNNGKAKLRGTFTGFVASFRDRLAALPSRASNGTLSVSRVVSRSVSLIAV